MPHDHNPFLYFLYLSRPDLCALLMPQGGELKLEVLMELILGGVIAGALLIYLAYALLHPEKF